MTPGGDLRTDRRTGLLQAFGAYGIWGAFPIYIHALAPAGAWEVLAHRILWTLLLCLGVLAALGRLPGLLAALRRPRLLVGVAIAAVLIGINWLTYVIAVLGGRTHEAALGYFLNPLATVALGVLVLGERLRRLQWVAIAIGALAGVYLVAVAGSLPWVSAALAASFALYGLAKNKLGASLPALESLTAETIVLAPAAAVTVALLAGRHATTFTGHGWGHTILLVLAGAVTAAPLLLFAASARRIPLALIGLVQFCTPVIQLLLGVLVLGEHLPRERWVAFGIVWVALIVLSWDSVRALRSRRADAREAAGPVRPA
ncbi:EamA family transporter RarD [Janibacter massiliensis]|uniref:EamA family transporter RarD n=1 Tax=Janibacter massiliensis TaxID=2058291 RepID=UPI000D0F2F16|nr:EamA family transporter RarD [Janibacter massiliensis]